MKRVLVIGCGGAGKSTFARRLGKNLKLPVIHLDMHFWKPYWQQTETNEWRAKVSQLCNQDEWIMDGNFGETADIRYAAADTIVFLDLPRLVCLFRWLKRCLRFRNGGRPDMSAGCVERINWEYIKWVWNFSNKDRPRILERVQKYSPNSTFVHLNSQDEVNGFLSRLPTVAESPGRNNLP